MPKVTRSADEWPRHRSKRRAQQAARRAKRTILRPYDPLHRWRRDDE
ncbi:MAG: hypothetical protein V9E85_04430 [Candidatus Nanopelagicales bacterium]|jgi:hypothetical protein